ncbi:hypothetical protein [Flavobacterium sp.]|uniref:hypothetical protein n=1 Tax=Flavobacterium sp. TaxID=239 RepID=UPI003BBF44BA
MAIIKKTVQNLKPGKEYILTVKPKDVELNVELNHASAIRFVVPNDLSIPEDLSNLVIVGNYKSIMISFNPSNELDLKGYNYQVYLAEDIGQSGSSYVVLNNATPYLSGFSTANVIAIDVPQNSETTNSIDQNTGTTTTTTTEKLYFVRVQSVDTSDNTSPYTKIVASTATTLIDSAHIVNLTASKITAGTIGAHTITMAGINSILKSSNYLAANTTFGGTGWKISGDGTAVFNNASIRSTLDIGEDQGTSDNTSFHVDTNGNMWLGANRASFSSAPFKVTNTGAVTASSLTLTGTTILSTGNTNKIYLGVGVYNNTNTPFYVDGSSQFSLGTKLTWNGTTLTIRGSLKLEDGTDAINATDAQDIADDAVTALETEIQSNGFIGGLTITSTAMYYGAGTFNNANTAFFVGNNGGQANFSLGNKLVYNTSANTLTVTGTIVANAGNIR